MPVKKNVRPKNASKISTEKKEKYSFWDESKKPSTKEIPIVKFRAEPDALSRLSKFPDAKSYPKEYRKQVFGELLDFCTTEQRRLSIDQFCFLKGIHKSAMEEWCKHDDWAQKMWDTALSMLANRRYEMALFKEIDKDMFKWNQHKYDKDAIENNMHMIKLAQKIAETERGKIPVEIINVPETNEVPPRKDK